MAAKAGKDIYVEKPISLTIAEARAMVEAVRRYDRVCQSGLQQRSTREFRLACQLVRDGAIGKIQAVYVTGPGTSAEVNLPAEPVPESLDWNLWLGPAPWRPFNHRFVYLGQAAERRPLGLLPRLRRRQPDQRHGPRVRRGPMGIGHGSRRADRGHSARSRNLPRPDLQVPRRRARASRAGPAGPQQAPDSRGLGREHAASGLRRVVRGRAGLDSRGPRRLPPVLPGRGHQGLPGRLRSADRRRKPPPQLVRGDPHPRPPGLRRGGGLPVDDRLPPGLHRLLDRPGLEVGPGRRAVPGRRRSQPPAVAGHARTVASVAARVPERKEHDTS